MMKAFSSILRYEITTVVDSGGAAVPSRIAPVFR